VLTIVLKLFNIIRPNVAVFGEKDAQQLACIQRMVTDLNIAIEIVGAPIVRDPDGLAMSSRNVFLTASERGVARSLSAALEKAATQSSVPSARAAAYEVLDRAEAEPCFELDYAAIVNPATFAEVPDDHVGLATFVVAARVGETRLIDNTTIHLAPTPWPDIVPSWRRPWIWRPQPMSCMPARPMTSSSDGSSSSRKPDRREIASSRRRSGKLRRPAPVPG
jgi:pantoate--beta-alanine ligase